MKFLIPSIQESPASLLRRAGYVFQYEREGEMSFIRALARAGFPRFHCYIHREGVNLAGNIHLDRKKETYGRVARHHGEYAAEGPLQEEVERIRSIVGTLTLIA